MDRSKGIFHIWSRTVGIRLRPRKWFSESINFEECYFHQRSGKKYNIRGNIALPSYWFEDNQASSLIKWSHLVGQIRHLRGHFYKLKGENEFVLYLIETTHASKYDRSFSRFLSWIIRFHHHRYCSIHWRNPYLLVMLSDSHSSCEGEDLTGLLLIWRNNGFLLWKPY